MSKQIVKVFFVKKGSPIGGENIIGKLIPNIIPTPFVRSGDTFTLDFHLLGYDPYPGIQKDLIIVLKDNGIELDPISFSERNLVGRDNQDRGIKIQIPWSYEQKSEKQIKGWYETKRRDGLSEFADYQDFRNWYDENVQGKNCAYCGLTERESQEVVHHGLLTSNRFPLNGRMSQGINRGYWLEVDRKDPKGKYSRANSVPCCYFCNNDKCDVFDSVQYRQFVKDRPGFVRNLLKK